MRLVRIHADTPSALGACLRWLGEPAQHYLRIGLAISLLVHAAALAWRFGAPAWRRPPAAGLEVVLLNARSETPPDAPRVIAQNAMTGGGNASQGMASTPLPRTGQSAETIVLEATRQRQMQLEAEQARLMTQLRSADKAGVERFVFASTCSNYGKMPDPSAYVDENSELRPVSLYAETKVAVERYLLGLERTRRAKPTCLRFATVYGMSPRMRFDLTVNEFTRQVVTGKELVVFGEQFWRPYCHVRDLARSVVHVLESPEEKVAFDVFNVGDTAENYRKLDIVEAIVAQVPEARVSYVKKDEDPRDYRVSFAKIRDVLGFQVTRTVPDGIREIREAIEDGLLTQPYSPAYANVPAAGEATPFA